VIEIRAVSKTFSFEGRETPALLPVDLTLPTGSFVSFVGPSGCGKSTLLNMMAGLVAPSQGAIVQDGIAVAGINTRVGYMTQQDNLLPWRTTAENVAMPLLIRGQSMSAVRPRVMEMLRKVGIEGFANHFPSQLSGGMRKRASLAQVLVYDPQTILMDEPFGALDAQLKVAMQMQLLALWENAGKSIVFVTHDLAEAILLSDFVVVFSGRPGSIKAFRPIGLPRPRDPIRGQFAADFREIYEELWNMLAPDVAREAKAGLA
jgi:NitT/TauT family transport system ATP-binding protein